MKLRVGRFSGYSRFLVCLAMLFVQFSFLGEASALAAPSKSTAAIASNGSLNSVNAMTAQASSTNPVLLIYNDSYSGNVFSKFLGEIMRAEGFNLFDTAQLSSVTATTLAGYDSVVLAQTSLTGAQATMFSTYVQNGGNLIAMRPDASLASMMGLGTAAGTLSNGYMAIQTATTYGQGFAGSSLQLHTTADQYSGVTAQKVALLYSNAATSTIYPAVTVNNFGNGKAIAFTYDLATSVVYTRQGNPALADVDADGDGINRIVDLYYNWIDLTKMGLPQADIQQRLFGRILSQLNSLKRPLPRFWYFPNAGSTTIVMTSDAHGNPDSYFQTLVTSMNRYNVTTSFYGRYGPDPSVLAPWLAAGYTYNIHPYKIGNPNLTAGYQEAEDWYTQRYGPTPTHTVRVHRLEDQGWVDATKVASAFGYVMDYSYYRYGTWLQRSDGSWVRGYMMGSSMPMKTIDQTGQIVNVFGQYTEIADDQMNYPGPENMSNDDSYLYTKQAIDTSTGGTFEPVVIQAHVDYYGSEQSWFESTMAYGRNQNLPFMNGDQWSDFTQARYNGSFSNLNWASNQLTFNLAVPTGPSSQTIMLPSSTGTSNIQTVKINNTTTSFTTKTINGESFALVVVPAGNSAVAVTYQADTTPPVISNITAVPSGTQAQINWTTNELSSSKVNYGPTNALGSTATTAGNTTNHSVQLTGLTVGQTYFFQVVSADLSNNTATSTTSSFVATNAAPTISQVTPPTVVNNQATTITITGSNFISTPSVLLGSQSLTGVTFNSTSSLTAQIPAGVTPGVYNLTVTNPDNASATLANSVTVKLPAPALSTVSPNSAANNATATITLNGSNFVSGATVRLGTTNLSGVTFVSATKLTATVPSGLNQGVYDLTVTNPDTQSSTLAASFTVGPPASGPSLNQVSPAVVVNVNANTVTLSGSNFVGPITVALSGANQSGATLVSSSSITLNLAAGFTPGTYDVTVTNGNGQSTTMTGGLVVLPNAVLQNTQADFAGGALSNTTVTSRLGGEVKLKAGLEDYFAGSTLNSSVWTSGAWTSGGTTTVSNGSLAVQGSYVHTLNNISLNRLEFTAKFSSNAPNQHIGYSPDLSSDWILFSVPGFDTSKIYARSNVNGTNTDTALNVSLDAFHDFVITVTTGAINFFVDGTLVATHNVTANNPAPIWFSNATNNGSLVIDSIQAGSYPTTGTFQSSPLDAGQTVTWNKLNWQLNLPSTTTASIQARTSNDANTWTAWSAASTTAGDVALSLNPGRYLQYTLNLGSNDPTQSPEILSVAGVYGTVSSGPLARIAVTPATPTLVVGATQQFTAQGYDSNNVPLNGLTYTWSTTGGGTINSASGLYTAGSVAGDYPSSVVATSGSVTGNTGVSIRSNPPSVTSVTPNTGATNVATSISINGSNFVTGATAKLGTTALGSVTFVSAAKLTAVVPAGLAQGSYDLTVTNPDNQQATLTGAFTVGPPASGPTISKVIPAVVSNTAANTITLTGQNFTTPVTVALSGTNVSGVTVNDPTSLSFNVPSGYSAGNYDVTVTNGAGQNTTLAAGLVVLPTAVIQNTQADFATGTFTNSLALARLDGEIKLKSSLEDQFSGAALDSSVWTSAAWSSGGTATTANGLLSVAGAYAHTINNFALNRLSFRAKFSSNTPYQHIGYSEDLSTGWILFSVPGFDATKIYARSSVNGVSNDTPLTVSMDNFHDFTINVLASSIQFVVDGTVVATHPVTANNPTLIWFSNGNTSSPLVVDSLQAGPYAGSGAYVSAPLDAGQSVSWTKLNWQLNRPANTTATIQARTSTDGTTWTAWSSPVSTAGDVPLSLAAGRFLQYSLTLGTTDTSLSPEVLSVAGVYGSAGPGPLARIAVTPGTANLAAGATQQFTAQGYDSNNTALSGLTYTWSTTGGGAINSASGLYTAGTTGGSFPASVVATSGSVNGTADVTIAASAPTVSAISPNTGSNAAAVSVTITGTNFVATPTVKLGTTSLTGVTLVSATQLTATVPAGIATGTYTLTVTNPDNQQGTLANAYTSTLTGPGVSAVSPNSGANNAAVTITITGTNFVATPAVKLGTTALASVTFVSATKLTAVVPSGFAAGVYSLTVTNPDNQQATLANAYTSTLAGPGVSAVSPNSGANNAAVNITITGTNFVATPTVKLGTTSLTGVTFVSATQLTATVPAGIAVGSYSLTVTNPDNQQGTLANAYTATLPGPTLTSVAPTSGVNNAAVTLTITGTNFVATPAVKLGTTALASVTFVSATKLTAVVPSGFATGTYNLTVVNPDNQQATLANAYTSVAQPTVTAISPNNRDNALARSVTITGTNFAATPTVKLGTTSLTNVVFVSATQLTATVPAGITPGVYTLTVTNPSGQAGTLGNAYTATAAPTVSQNPANFGTGLTSNTDVTQSGSNYDVALTPTFEDEFSGTNLNSSNWTFTSTGSSSSATVNGVVNVRSGFIRNQTSYVRGVVEGRVLFPTPSNGTSQDFGWSTGSVANPWALFGVPSANPNGIYARTNIGNTAIDTRINSLQFNTYYNLRIVVGTTTVTYYVNNVQVAQHAVSSSSTNTGLNIYLYNNNSSTSSSNALQADWIRVDSFPSSGLYISPTFDSNNAATTWTNLNWTGNLPTGTGLSVQVQTSKNGTSWNTLSAGSTTPSTNVTLTGQTGRYLRYVVTFTPSSDQTFTPVFTGITLTYSTQT